MFCCIFVISLGRLFIRRIISFILGWLEVMFWVSFFISFVFLVFGGVMIKVFWFFFIGLNKFSILLVILVGLYFNLICLLGNRGVRLLNKGWFLILFEGE